MHGGGSFAIVHKLLDRDRQRFVCKSVRRYKVKRLSHTLQQAILTETDRGLWRDYYQSTAEGTSLLHRLS